MRTTNGHLFLAQAKKAETFRSHYPGTSIAYTQRVRICLFLVCFSHEMSCVYERLKIQYGG